MVQNPVCAELWQPLCFIRQTMLENSFSFLPVKDSTGTGHSWKLIADLDVARYLLQNPVEREKRLVTTLEDARKHCLDLVQDTDRCHPDDSVQRVLGNCKGKPILVTRKDSGELIGILTPHDLL